MSKLNFKSENVNSLETLLMGFFEYYSQFDFASKAVCINEAVSISKPEYSPLYIVNPLERGLNVSKNVSLEEVERFKIEVRNAAWSLESQENKLENKGLLSILENQKNRIKYNLNFAFSTKQNRLMEIKTLFNEDDNPENSKIEFKNKTVEKQVKNIKKETQESIKSLEMEQTRRKSRGS